MTNPATAANQTTRASSTMFACAVSVAERSLAVKLSGADGFNKTSASSRFALLLLHLFFQRASLESPSRYRAKIEGRIHVCERCRRAVISRNLPSGIVRCRYSSESNARTALCSAFREILLHNFGRLLFERGIIPSNLCFSGVFQRNHAGHPPCLRDSGSARASAPSRFPRRHHILCEGVSGVKEYWADGKRHRHVCDSEYCVRESVSRMSWGSPGQSVGKAVGSRENHGARSKPTRLALELRIQCTPFFVVRHAGLELPLDSHLCRRRLWNAIHPHR